MLQGSSRMVQEGQGFGSDVVHLPGEENKLIPRMLDEASEMQCCGERKSSGQLYHELVSNTHCSICPAAQDLGRPLTHGSPASPGGLGHHEWGHPAKKHAQMPCLLPGWSHWLPLVIPREKWCCKGGVHATGWPYFTTASSITLSLSLFEFISMFLTTTRSHGSCSKPQVEPHHPISAGTCTFPGKRRGLLSSSDHPKSTPLGLQTKNLSHNHISGMSAQSRGDVCVYGQI